MTKTSKAARKVETLDQAIQRVWSAYCGMPTCNDWPTYRAALGAEYCRLKDVKTFGHTFDGVRM